MSNNWDVLIVGAGPAGSAAAAFLADQGHKVLVLEKESFPRFHIGESLLPACMRVLKRLGVEPLKDTYVYKHGARFVCEESDRAQSFAFSEALPGCSPHAWHVERSSFDTQLRDRALSAGAEIRHNETVVNAGADADSAWIETKTGRESGRFLIDASGQNRLMARRMGTVEHLTDFGLSAVFTHFEGIPEAAVEELGPGFEIRIMVRPGGWGWIIPLPGARLSVGVVGRTKMTKPDLDAGLLADPMMTRLAEGARRLDTQVIGNFSYQNTGPLGPRFAALGDASAFLDPVFSSGVTLALRGAEGLTDILGPALKAGTEAAPELLDEHQAAMDRACRTFAALIHRFYHTNFVNSFFLTEAPNFEMRRGVMTVLAGHVWRTDNPFQEMLLSSRLNRPKSVPS